MNDQLRSLPAKSLLEHGELPLTELAAFAKREGRRPRAIYTAHKWFARRLGSVFRALLVGAASSLGDDFWQGYYGVATLRGLTVLDPFVGGGTSVVEATRLGASAIGIDVDPVACSVTELELMAAQIPSLDGALAHLQETVGKSVRRYHTFTTPDGVDYQVLHHFWVQIVTCVECGTEIQAHPSFQLARDNDRQWVICSQCGHVDAQRSGCKTFQCTKCNGRTEIAERRVDYGRVICPSCGRREPLIEVSRRTETTPRWHEFAVEVLALPDGGRAVPMKQRLFFAADEQVHLSYQSASRGYQRRRETHRDTFPDLIISETNRFDSRLIDYGYRQWTDLFNPRQLLHLSLLVEAIKAYEEPLRTALAMAFSDHLTTNCMLTSYAGDWRRLTPLFSVRAFRHIPRPVELNPWIDGSGRGTFPNTVRKLIRAISYARKPQEPILGGGFKSVPSVDSKAPPRVHCGTARDLSFIEDVSVDLVLTDPPYFDNIAYSELAEFFLPWLQLLEVVPRDIEAEEIAIESLIGRRDDPETILHYTKGISNTFSEIVRVLKPSGMIVFSYRHTSPDAWLALANAIAPHSLSVVRVLPVPGEAGVGLHVHKGTGLWDAVFVLRYDTQASALDEGGLKITMANVANAEALAVTWAARLANAPVAFTDIDRMTLERAALVGAALTQSRHPRCSDSISLAKALSDVK